MKEGERECARERKRERENNNLSDEAVVPVQFGVDLAIADLLDELLQDVAENLGLLQEVSSWNLVATNTSEL